MSKRKFICEEDDNKRDWETFFTSTNSVFFVVWGMDAIQEYNDLLTPFYKIGMTCKGARLNFEKHIKKRLLDSLVCYIFSLQYKCVYGNVDSNHLDVNQIDPNGIFINVSQGTQKVDAIHERGKFLLNVVNKNKNALTTHDLRHWAVILHVFNPNLSSYLGKRTIDEWFKTKQTEECNIEYGILTRHHVIYSCPLGADIWNFVTKNFNDFFDWSRNVLIEKIRKHRIKTKNEKKMNTRMLFALADIPVNISMLYQKYFIAMVEKMSDDYDRYANAGYPILSDEYPHVQDVYEHPQNTFFRFFSQLFGYRFKQDFDRYGVMSLAYEGAKGLTKNCVSKWRHKNLFDAKSLDETLIENVFNYTEEVLDEIAKPLYDLMQKNLTFQNGKVTRLEIRFCQNSNIWVYCRIIRKDENLIMFNDRAGLVRMPPGSKYNRTGIKTKWIAFWNKKPSGLTHIQSLVSDNPMSIEEINKKINVNPLQDVQDNSLNKTFRQFVIFFLCLLQKDNAFEILGRLCSHCLLCGRELNRPGSVNNAFGPVCSKRFFGSFRKKGNPSTT